MQNGNPSTGALIDKMQQTAPEKRYMTFITLVYSDSGFFRIFKNFPIFGAVYRQMNLSPSSGGVGWANGYCDIVFVVCASRLATI